MKKWGAVAIGLMPWDSSMYNTLKLQVDLCYIIAFFWLLCLQLPGSFFSHTLVFLSRVFVVGSYTDVKKWGIVGIGLMPWDSKMYNILKSQDHLYTLLSRGHTGSEARVVGSIVDFMFAPDNHQAVIDKVHTHSCRINSPNQYEIMY